MAATLTVYPWPQGIDNTQHRIRINGAVAISGTYAAGGFATVWTSLTESTTGQAVLLPTSKTAPFIAYFQSASGSGFVYQYNVATNKIQIFTGAAAQGALTELAAGTVPTGVSGDVIQYEAEFVRATT